MPKEIWGKWIAVEKEMETNLFVASYVINGKMVSRRHGKSYDEALQAIRIAENLDSTITVYDMEQMWENFNKRTKK